MEDKDKSEILKLLRDKEAFINVGGRDIPLPPAGRVSYPKQFSVPNTLPEKEEK